VTIYKDGLTLHMMNWLWSPSGNAELSNLDGLTLLIVLTTDLKASLKPSRLLRLLVRQIIRYALYVHADGVAAMDLFVVPTVSFRLLSDHGSRPATNPVMLGGLHNQYVRT
jgi:hypothetical protein